MHHNPEFKKEKREKVITRGPLFSVELWFHTACDGLRSPAGHRITEVTGLNGVAKGLTGCCSWITVI